MIFRIGLISWSMDQMMFVILARNPLNIWQTQKDTKIVFVLCCVAFWFSLFLVVVVVEDMWSFSFYNILYLSIFNPSYDWYLNSRPTQFTRFFTIIFIHLFASHGVSLSLIIQRQTHSESWLHLKIPITGYLIMVC